MNQHEWVYGCYAHYLENQVEPGNPEDGAWEAAHWPVPKCKGGRKTILLLKEHHAVHGVLQSEEWQHPCVFGWEKQYLTGETLEQWRKWMAKKGQLGAQTNLANTPTEVRGDRSRNGLAKYTSGQLSERTRKGHARKTKDQRRESTRAASAALAQRTPEQRRESALKREAIKRLKRQTQ